MNNNTTHTTPALNSTTTSTTTTNTTTTDPSAGARNAGATTGNVIKEGLAKFHGAGEAIRGNINTFADNVTGTSTGKSEAEAQRGVDELQTGKFQGGHAGAGVTPKDTPQERVNHGQI